MLVGNEIYVNNDTLLQYDFIYIYHICYVISYYIVYNTCPTIFTIVEVEVGIWKIED